MDPSGHLTQLGREIPGAGARWEKRALASRGAVPVEITSLAGLAQAGPSHQLGLRWKLIASQTSRFSQVPVSLRMIPKPYQSFPSRLFLGGCTCPHQEGADSRPATGPWARWPLEKMVFLRTSRLPQASPPPARWPATLGAAKLRPLALSQPLMPLAPSRLCLERLPLVPPMKMEQIVTGSHGHASFLCGPHILLGNWGSRLSQPRRQGTLD